MAGGERPLNLWFTEVFVCGDRMHGVSVCVCNKWDVGAWAVLFGHALGHVFSTYAELYIRKLVWFLALYPADLRPHLGGRCHWAVVGSRSWCGGVGQRARGLWKGDLWLVWEWKVWSSRTPGLNPPSEFSCYIDITFKPCLVCCWIVQRSLG